MTDSISSRRSRQPSPFSWWAGGIATMLAFVLIVFGPERGHSEWLTVAMVPVLGACYLVAWSYARQSRPVAATSATIAGWATVALMAELAAYLLARGPATGLYAALLLAVLSAALANRWWHLALIWILFVGPVIAFDELDAQTFRQPVVQIGSFAITMALSTAITYVVGTRLKWIHFQLLDDARHRARRDALTGVLNHLGWQERIAGSSVSDGHEGIVVFFDVDHFREVNNRAGHRVGDQLLVYLATNLLNAMGPDAIVARLGGDEFAVFLPAHQADTFSTRLDDLQRRLEQSSVWSGITVTHGIGTCNAGQSVTDAWVEADLNLNKAKHQRPSVRSLHWQPPTPIVNQERVVG